MSLKAFTRERQRAHEKDQRLRYDLAMMEQASSKKGSAKISASSNKSGAISPSTRAKTRGNVPHQAEEHHEVLIAYVEHGPKRYRNFWPFWPGSEIGAPRWLAHSYFVHNQCLFCCLPVRLLDH